MKLGWDATPEKRTGGTFNSVGGSTGYCAGRGAVNFRLEISFIRARQRLRRTHKGISQTPDANSHYAEKTRCGTPLDSSYREASTDE